MQFRIMPKGADKLSILGFGCMRFETLEDGTIIEDKALQMLKHAYDNGVNYFDTAWPYHGGRSEPLLGKFLQSIDRKQVFVATKLPSWLITKPEDFMDYLRQQLEKLQTDYIDYYLVHSINKGFWKNLRQHKLFAFLDEAKQSGLIRNIGFSFHDEYKLFKTVVDAYDWDFCQIMLNYVDTHYQAGLKGYHYAVQKGLGIVIMEPLRGGKIAANIPPDISKLWEKSPLNYTPAERALHWLWNLPSVHVILSGMSTLDQLRENLRIADEARADSIDERELIRYKKARRMYLQKIQIPCTTCRYCLPCPSKLAIPFLFGQYNDAFIFGDKQRHKREYELFFAPETRADKCTSCGACLPKCPRGIDIPANMKQIAAFFGD